MEDPTQLARSRVAVFFVGLVASFMASAVAFVSVIAYRHRLSSITIRASCKTEEELATTTNPPLIATTLSVLSSPVPKDSQDYRPPNNTLHLSSFHLSRWEQVKGSVVDIQDRIVSAWTSLRDLLRDRATFTSSDSVMEVEIATPCSHPTRPNPSLQNTGDVSSTCRPCLYCTPMGGIGVI
ncbi:hypothetical protein PsorP6_010891 [Peronosclerospora sorghi]|uniref:Uncharacterized protein n=1 Tax=Peronosclerospora sorghi TaxID=230839 RepID=A0ACC0VY20_9STRA|nr:hypothetical protein PsorP6_010891 [Peronosclerospora sorghi]